MKTTIFCKRMSETLNIRMNALYLWHTIWLLVEKEVNSNGRKFISKQFLQKKQAAYYKYFIDLLFIWTGVMKGNIRNLLDDEVAQKVKDAFAEVSVSEQMLQKISSKYPSVKALVDRKKKKNDRVIRDLFYNRD
ncbi:MAG: hypothetical protein NT120_00475 [Candidatus Aenigmarchaeota archaeon]|nr:hypothetical protein [Candidatus Aenigmarchaeota archaeon]